MLNRALDGTPASSITALEASRSVFVETLRTSTEYSAHVIPAASKLRFPRKSDEERFAVRGSMTAMTPSVETASARLLRQVGFSWSRNGAKSNTNAGVADVTRAPLEAVESFVPTNWNPSEMP